MAKETRQNKTLWGDLTPVGKKIVSALREDPRLYLLNTTELCKKVGVSRAQYYELFKSDKAFKQAVRELVDGAFLRAALPISHKIAEQALRGSFAHQKLILEHLGMAGRHRKGLGLRLDLEELSRDDEEEYA